MIVVKINDVRSCNIFVGETIYQGENNISGFCIHFPDNFGKYDRAECAIEMRCYITEYSYISYELDTSRSIDEQAITFDITDEPRNVNVMFIITHTGAVIGKTNTVTFRVHNAPETDDTPLTPRSQFDEVIADLRAQVAELESTVSDQQEHIEADSRTISSLNEQVNDLTAENEQLIESISEKNAEIEELNRQLATSRLIDLDIELNSLDFFKNLDENTIVSGIVNVIEVVSLSEKLEIENKFPNLTVNAVDVLDLDNYVIDKSEKLIADSDGNVLTFNSGGVYHSNYTASDIDRFIDDINENLEG